jgi:predicted DNA-binding ribbon-helix-helix protein
MRLEPEMWAALAEIAGEERVSLHALVTGIAAERGVNLTSAVRCFVITYYMRQAPAAAPSHAGRDAAAWTAERVLSFKA